MWLVRIDLNGEAQTEKVKRKSLDYFVVRESMTLSGSALLTKGRAHYIHTSYEVVLVYHRVHPFCLACSKSASESICWC